MKFKLINHMESMMLKLCDKLKSTCLAAVAGLGLIVPFAAFAEDYAEIADEVIPAYFATEKGKCLAVGIEGLAVNGTILRDGEPGVFFQKMRVQNLTLIDKLVEKGLFTKTEGKMGSTDGYFYHYTDAGKQYTLPEDELSLNLCVGAATLKKIDKVADKPKRSFGQESVAVDITVDYSLVKPFSDPDVKEIKVKNRSPFAKYDGKTDIKQKGTLSVNKNGDWVYEKSFNPLDPNIFL